MTDEPLNDELLKELTRQTAQLPREIAPPSDAWDRIRDEIEGESIVRPSTDRRVYRVWQSPPVLAAAAFLLVAATAITTASLMRRPNPASPLARASTPAPSNDSAPASLAQFTAIENDYIGTANRLSAMIESGHSDLSPETIAKLKESLRVIDAAILEARRALAADPANKALMEMLSTSYSQKVDLLRRTAEMGRS